MRFVKTTLSTLISASVILPSFALAEKTPVVEKPIQLTIHHHQKKFVYDDQWPVEKEAARLTNVSLKNVTTKGTNNSDAAFNLLIASGDLPDIVSGMNIKQNVNQYGPQGAFIPLDELIDKHAPNIKAFLEKHPKLKSSIVAADGKMYYVPYFPDGKYARGYFIRYDWLNKLNLDVPETVDEFYEVLKAFKTQDPNGNGKADEIPYFARQPEELVRLVTLWDGRTSGSDSYHDFYVNNGKMTHGYSEDNYKEGIKHLTKWYKEGLIDPEIFTRGSRAREFLLSNDLGGSTHDWFASTSSYNDALEDKIEGFTFKAFAPPASVSGNRVAENRRAPVKSEGWSISYTNEHPVETIKYFDFWFSEEGRRLGNFGVEGVHYDLVDGKAKFKKEVLEADSPVAAQMWAAGAQIFRGFPQDYEYEKQWTNKHALEGIAIYDQGDYLLEPFLGVTLNEDEKAVYDKHWPSILTYMLEMQQAWILGSRDIEQDWPSYVKSLNKMGYSKVTKAMQSAYERQYN